MGVGARDAEATVADLVEAQVARSPEAIALVAGGRSFSYAELDSWANRLAQRLRDAGVGPETLVGVCGERSAETAVGLLAVLKAGGACVPLDPSYPAERLAFMVADASPVVLLAPDHLLERLPEGVPVVRLDDAGAERTGQLPEPPGRHGTAEGAAYVIYTSGSTGEPKGVMLSHRGLVNHHRMVVGRYGLGPGDRVLQFCSISFDISIEEIFPTWAAGATVVLRPDELPVLGRPWVRWLAREGVTVLNLPTAYWHEWARDLQASGDWLPGPVRLVVVGGEKALGGPYQTWLEVGGDQARWINAYGPTEATVMATAYEPLPGASGRAAGVDPPIGRAVAGTTAHVLDAHGQAVAPSEAGEIHLGGVGLARGYLGQPGLTAERFVPDPWSEEPGGRLYRTGDLARLLPSGDLEFVGRLDDQVKVRGFRIECGEVERALERHPDVDQAVVSAREVRPGDHRLVAHVVAAGSAAPAGELRRFLAERLPSYMVPMAFVDLEALPLTPNGKVDREALPAPNEARRGVGGAFRAPRTPAEEVVAGIWTRALGIEDLGVDDDFFELGGHSLLATQVVAGLCEAFATALPLRAIFEDPTVARLAARLGSGGGPDQAPPLVTGGPVSGAVPLTLAQEQMWALETTAGPGVVYNVTVLRRFAGSFDDDALRRALAHLVARHDSLRTAFPIRSGRPQPTVAGAVHVDVVGHDLSAVPAGDREAELRRRLADQDRRPFADLAAPPLLRAGVYRLDATTHQLAVTFDHLICDGPSAYVFSSELQEAYAAFSRGQAPGLRPLSVQYADFARWQRRWMTEDRLAAQLDYWVRTLAGMRLGPAVPFDGVPEAPSRRLSSIPVAVPPATYRLLAQLARGRGCTIFVVALASVAALCRRWGGPSDMVFSTTLSGRSRAELEGVVGCFSGFGRLRVDLAGDPPFATVMARARETALGLFEHQDIPFLRVRRALFPDFPGQRRTAALLAAVPTELQYFRAAHDEWTPGAGVVEQPGGQTPHDGLFFRGQLQPLSITLLDDGTQLWGDLSYKVDYYDEATVEGLAQGLDRLLPAVAADPDLRLSDLPRRAPAVPPR